MSDVLDPWREAELADLRFTLEHTTPDQRMAWLEEAFEQALGIAIDRLERDLPTIDADGELWPDARAVEYLWRTGRLRHVPDWHPAARQVSASCAGPSTSA